MVIQSLLFISFWAVISFAFLHLGFHALDKTELLHSVSPVVMFLFKHSLAVSSCFSSCYALKIRVRSTYAVLSNSERSHYVCGSFIFPRAIEGIVVWCVIRTIHGFLLVPAFSCLLTFQFPLKTLVDIFHTPRRLRLPVLFYPFNSVYAMFPIPNNPVVDRYLTWIYIIMVDVHAQVMIEMGNTYYGSLEILLSVFSLMLCCVTLGLLIVDSRDYYYMELKTRAYILLALEMSIFYVSANNSNFSPILVLFISHYICVLVYLLRFGESMEGLVGTTIKIDRLKEHKAKKLIKFGIGALGSVLFQSFFKITSFSEVAAFLCFTVVWLANQVLLGFKADFGIFNFLLLNVVVGCTVGQFGLHGETWLALVAAILLYAVALKLHSIAIPYEPGQQMQFSFFETNI